MARRGRRKVGMAEMRIVSRGWDLLYYRPSVAKAAGAHGLFRATTWQYIDETNPL